MKQLSTYLIYLLLFTFSTIATAETTTDPLSTFKQTYQCPNCNLSNADLSNFNTTTLTPKKSTPDCNIDLSLKQANLTNANLSKTNFTACARGAVTPFRKIDFSDANLSRATLDDSHFYSASFQHANLPESRLENVHMDLCNFMQANFSHAHLVSAQSTRDAMHGWGSNFYMANFCGADLSNANLYGFFQTANFAMANLSHATLTSTEDTIPANFPNAEHMNGANLWLGVNFTGANLTGAHFYTANNQPADLSQARFCHTTMPDGKINDRDCPAGNL